MDHLFGSLGPSLLVRQVTDHFQMGRVAAQAVVTEMVDLLLPRDVPIEVGVDDQVNSHSLAIEAHAAIATTPASAGVRASPQEAG